MFAVQPRNMYNLLLNLHTYRKEECIIILLVICKIVICKFVNSQKVSEKILLDNLISVLVIQSSGAQSEKQSPSLSQLHFLRSMIMQTIITSNELSTYTTTILASINAKHFSLTQFFSILVFSYRSVSTYVIGHFDLQPHTNSYVNFIIQ